MKIVEIFDSIQGEGMWIGIPCTFIRLAGCNLRCDFCDSKLTWSEGREDIGLQDIVDRVNYTHVVITGGEPTQQAVELSHLISMLQNQKQCIVGIESNGTYENYKSLYCNHVVVSPKAAAMYAVFPSGVDELKYVVTEDFNADVAIPEVLRQKFAGRIWLQPCDYGDSRTQEMFKKAYRIAMKDDRLRVGIQLHKIIGVE